MTPRLVRCTMWLGLVLLGPLAAVPASSQDRGVCGSIKDIAARSACVAVGRAARAARPRPGPPSVRSVVGPVTPERAEAVDGGTIAGAPDGYVGRPLAMRGGDCRYVDVNRYVCTIAGVPPVEIHAHVIMPPPAQVAVEAGRACGGKGASLRRRPCNTLLIFAPDSARTSGGSVVLTTSSIWIRMSQ